MSNHPAITPSSPVLVVSNDNWEIHHQLLGRTQRVQPVTPEEGQKFMRARQLSLKKIRDAQNDIIHIAVPFTALLEDG
ncbi:hypothetical protein [Neptuniibacter sp. QD37_11]|uniref:hypothetical protein n=1 Tax=Neptuniibacter sp. QD37_11 TaxID=3398209 RepID=UPI0039F618F1